MTYKIMIQTPISDCIKSVVESRDDVTYKQFTPLFYSPFDEG